MYNSLTLTRGQPYPICVVATSWSRWWHLWEMPAYPSLCPFLTVRSHPAPAPACYLPFQARLNRNSVGPRIYIGPVECT